LARAPHPALEIEHDVDDELAGSVVRDLPATIDLHDGDVSRRQKMSAVGAHAERVHGWMFDEPDLVATPSGSLGRECLHLGPHFDQRLQT